MKEMLKKEKGITLIALIITIIILVILAAVSISAVTNMGIVGYAVNGAEGYAKEGQKENEVMGDAEKLIENALTNINNGSSETPVEESYGLRADGKFYCNPDSYSDGDRIFSGLVYDSEHFYTNEWNTENGLELLYFIKEDGHDDEEVFHANGDFYQVYWAD